MKNSRAVLASILILSVSLSGCSSMQSNTRELEQLLVIQALGFDKTEHGVAVSAATGTGIAPSSARMTAEGSSISLAMYALQEYSTSEEIFYAHTSYTVLGQAAAEDGIADYLEFIERDGRMRLDTPIFVLISGDVSDFFLQAGGKEGDSFDATDILRSLERTAETEGSELIFSAADIISDLSESGAGLLAAIRTVSLDGVLASADSSPTVLPAGYTVISRGKAVGQIPADAALGVALLKNRSGSAYIPLSCGDLLCTVQLDGSDCSFTPVFSGGRLSALEIRISVSASLAEAEGEPDEKLLSELLRHKAEAYIRAVLDVESSLGCDFLQLGNIIERAEPILARGFTQSFSEQLGSVAFNIYADAKIDRSFDLPV